MHFSFIWKSLAMYARRLTAKASLLRLREDFIRDRLIFIKGSHLIPILKALGAVDIDFAKLKSASNNLLADPTLPFRKSRNGRFCFDFKKAKLRRLEFQPFALSAEEDFVRHDAGRIRTFHEIENDLQMNSVLHALFKFKASIFHGVATTQRPKLDYGCENSICTLFNLRTVTNKDMLGEPALEGVHSDGVDITMTTYLGSENMTRNSATTFIHSMEERNALRWNETNSDLVLGNHQHTDFLDTLLFADHERKHSLSPVFADNPEKAATRDMLVFFTRKPVIEGHISHKYDSAEPHLHLPMEKDLPLGISA